MASVTNNALNREIGELKTRMDSTETRLERMEVKIDTLVETIAMSRGSLKTLLAIGSVVAAITAGITSLITWALGRH